MRDGFRDDTGTCGFADTALFGVFLADVPWCDVNDGAKGDQVLAVDLPADVDLSAVEPIEDMKTYREWCVSAYLLDSRVRVRLLPHDEVDDIATRRRSGKE